MPDTIKLLAKSNKNYIKSNVDFVNKVIEFCDKEKNVENLENNGLLPDNIKILAKSDEKVITSNKDFVGKGIEFCDNNKVLADTFNKGYIEDVKSLTEKLKNKNESEAKLNEIEKKLNYQNELIKSISSLKEGEDVVNPEIKEENVKNATVQQKKNDTNILNEMTSFLENQENKNKLSELARKHKSGITAFQFFSIKA